MHFGFIRYKGHLIGYGQLRTERKILTVYGIRTHRDPEIPHQRRKYTRIDSASINALAYSSAKEYDQKIFYELNDRVIVSMRDRFECETSKLLEKFEGYVTGKNSNITAITSFYQKDFDSNRLSLHRQMFLEQITLKDVKIKSLQDVVNYTQLLVILGYRKRMDLGYF